MRGRLCARRGTVALHSVARPSADCDAKRSPKTSSASRPLRGEVRRGYRAQKLTTVCHPQMFDLLSLAGYGHQRGHTYLREAQDCGPFGGSCGHASLRAPGPEPF